MHDEQTDKPDLKRIFAELQQYVEINDLTADFILNAYQGDAQSAYALATSAANARLMLSEDMDAEVRDHIDGLVMDLFRYAAHLGHTEAMFQIAMSFATTETEDGNPEKFHYWLQKASDAGSLDAKAYLAVLSIDGSQAIPYDPALALRLAEEILALVDKEKYSEFTCQCLIRISYDLFSGDGIDEDPDKAFHYLHLLITQGCGEALEYYIDYAADKETELDDVDILCFRETLVFANEKSEIPAGANPIDYYHAVLDIDDYLAILEETAANGNRYSMWLLGCYYRAETDHRDLRKSLHWLNEAINRDNADAIVDKAYRMYLRACRHRKDYHKIVYRCQRLLVSKLDTMSPTIYFYLGVLELANPELSDGDTDRGLLLLTTAADEDKTFQLMSYLIAGLTQLHNTTDDDAIFSATGYISVVRLKMEDKEDPEELNPVFWDIASALVLDLPDAIATLQAYRSRTPEEGYIVDNALEWLNHLQEEHHQELLEQEAFDEWMNSNTASVDPDKLTEE